jgi:hypothetical protein
VRIRFGCALDSRIYGIYLKVYYKCYPVLKLWQEEFSVICGPQGMKFRDYFGNRVERCSCYVFGYLSLSEGHLSVSLSEKNSCMLYQYPRYRNAKRIATGYPMNMALRLASTFLVQPSPLQRWCMAKSCLCALHLDHFTFYNSTVNAHSSLKATNGAHSDTFTVQNLFINSLLKFGCLIRASDLLKNLHSHMRRHIGKHP